MVRSFCRWIAFVLIVAHASSSYGQSYSSASQAVGEARRYVSSGNYTLAYAAFRAAKRLDPNDGTILCEYGWAAFQASDYRIAEFELRTGVAKLMTHRTMHGASPSIDNALGACLYNFGRLEEEFGRFGSAETFYQQSLLYRPSNRATIDRIAHVRTMASSGSVLSSSARSLQSETEQYVSKLPIKSVSASTSSPPTASGVTYGPGNAVDGDRQTGWQVSVGGYGEWIRIDFGRDVWLNRLKVVNGYDKNLPDQYGDRWFLNNRVERIHVSWEGEGYSFHRFSDTRAFQDVELNDVRTSWVKLKILGIYPGSRWNDTIISEIEAVGKVVKIASSSRTEDLPGELVFLADRERAAGGPDIKEADFPSFETMWGRLTALLSERSNEYILGITLFFSIIMSVLSLMIRRRKSHRARALMKRVKRAYRAIEMEVSDLGECFDHVEVASRDLSERAPAIFKNIKGAKKALRRTRNLDGGARQRAAIEGQIARSFDRLEQIALRLEETAAELSLYSTRGSHDDVDILLHVLHHEIDIALKAEKEALSLLTAR